MDSDEDNALSMEMTRYLVAKVAPDELPIYRELVHAEIPKDVAGPKNGTDKEDVLGFGFGLVLVPIAAYAWQIVQSLLPVLETEAASIVRKEGHDVASELLRRKLRAIFKLDGPPQPASTPAADVPLEFTPAQRSEIRRATLEKAHELQLDDQRASLMADAIVGALETHV